MHSPSNNQMQLLALAGSLVAKRIAAQSETEQRRIDREIEVFRLQLEAQDRSARHGLIEKALAIISDTKNQQFEVLMRSYEDMMDLFKDHHASLLRERDGIHERMLELTDLAVINNHKRRLSAVNQELAMLKKDAMLLVANVNSVAQQIGSAFRMPVPQLSS